VREAKCQEGGQWGHELGFSSSIQTTQLLACCYQVEIEACFLSCKKFFASCVKCKTDGSSCSNKTVYKEGLLRQVLHRWTLIGLASISAQIIFEDINSLSFWFQENKARFLCKEKRNGNVFARPNVN
jgi:hypothetical protein